ncbi:LysR substrate-binding domain-containing protein [Cognatishimia sp. WU-CL00825]|uniref:LysR family transcriptional regulator n=1 Tax=Cognatishimia sp. WU-CL00825 TaxID=3127658 RepID=UPI00310442E4
MRPRQLYQFLSICREGSMSGAALELGIAQPALSKQIQQLEHELQVSLFERHSRGVTLTTAGKKLRVEAAEVIRRIEAIKTAIQYGDDDVSGSVELAVVASLAPALAVDLYPRIEKEYPKVALHIGDHSSESAGVALMREAADLAVIPNAATDLPEVQSVPLFEESFHFVSRANQGESSKPISFSEAAAQPLVLPFHSHDLRRRLEDTARGIGTTLNVKYQTGSINVIGALVEKGLACSIVPTTYWLDRIAARHLWARPVIEPSVSRVHSLCWLPDRVMSEAVQAVRETMIVEVQALVSAGKLSGSLSRT